MSRTRIIRAWREHPDLVLGGAVVLIGLVLRLALLFRAPPLLVLRDSASYALPALDLVQGTGFAPELKRPPLYPLFLAGSFWTLGENLQGVLFLQHVLGAVGVGLTYALARRIWGRFAAVVAGLVCALNGGLLLVEHSIMAEVLFAPLLVATMLAGTGVRTEHPIRWALLSGVLLGLTILTRPAALVLVPLLAVTLALLTPVTWRKQCLVGGALLLGSVGTAVPWMLRNQVVHGSFTVAGGLGEALISRTRHHDRHYPGSFGERAYVRRPPASAEDSSDRLAAARRWVYRQLARTDEADQIFLGLRREHGLSERDADRLLREIALRAIWEYRGDYLLSTAHMGTALFFNWDKSLTSMAERSAKPKLQEDWGSRGAILLGPLTPAQERESRASERLVSLYEHHRVSGLLAVLCLVGAAAAVALGRYRAALPTVLAVVVVLGVSVATAGPLVRYRTSVEPLIAVVAAGGLVGLWELGRVLLHGWSARRSLTGIPSPSSRGLG